MVAMIDDDWPAFEYITGPGAGVGKDADPGFIESLSRYMRAAANPSAVHAYEKMNGQIDTRPILPSIQAPTLVMNRTGGPCANVEAARDMASRIPGAKFNGPARAVRCALAIALAVRQLGIEVRAGVHTGECELMGDNVGGIAVHTGARIMAKAEPGGVFVSGTVKDLVSGSGINFQD